MEWFDFRGEFLKLTSQNYDFLLAKKNDLTKRPKFNLIVTVL